MADLQTGGDTRLESIVTEVATTGLAVVPDFVDATLAATWLAELERRRAARPFRPAQVGRGDSRMLRPDLRTDRILWLERDDSPLAAWFDTMDALRVALNRELYLGLFDFESHAAVYPTGAFYVRHLDQHAGTRDRLVTVILYLNPDWGVADGGELRVYLPEEGGERSRDVVPAAGTLAVFLSDRFEHEVLRVHRPRISLTGWFRRRPIV